MFIGQHSHNLEAKGRLAIPSPFREKLVSGGVITVGLDGCLFLFPNSYWQELSEKLAALPLTSLAARQLVRLLVQQASPLSFDAQGRTLVPDHLRVHASLKKRIIIAGALTRVEIWDADTYRKHLNLITQANPDWQESLKELNI